MTWSDLQRTVRRETHAAMETEHRRADAHRVCCGLEPIRGNRASGSLRSASLFAGGVFFATVFSSGQSLCVSHCFRSESSLGSSRRGPNQSTPTAFSTLRTSPTKDSERHVGSPSSFSQDATTVANVTCNVSLVGPQDTGYQAHWI